MRLQARTLWTVELSKRTLHAGCSVGGRVRLGARTLWNALNATKRTLQAAVWEAARA